VEKIKSLDFSKNQEMIAKIQKEQSKKAKEAKKYRDKVLKQKELEEDGTFSPGFARELASQRFTEHRKKKQAEETVDGKSSFAQCMFNLANILMGVGLLGLPFAFNSAGWMGGILTLTVFGLIAWRTSILIGREMNGDPRPSNFFVDSPFKTPLQPGSVPEARMYPPIKSFPDIARAAFGERGCVLLSIVLYFELFSCISIFLVSMGDHLHQLYPAVSAATHCCVVAAISMIPTILLRTPALLSYLSMVGTFATIAVVLSVVFSALVEGDISERAAMKQGLELAEPYHVLWNTNGLALSFGLVAYCFSGHAIVPSIYTSMREPQQFERMVTYTFGIVFVACIGVACSGYYMFGSAVKDQITLSLEQNSSAGTAMKALTWLMVLTGELSISTERSIYLLCESINTNTLTFSFSLFKDDPHNVPISYRHGRACRSLSH
jgi:vesicular inhibitory amino acid transporter